VVTSVDGLVPAKVVVVVEVVVIVVAPGAGGWSFKLRQRR